ncbi:MAG: heme exporter protein CcmD [Proteobacteria bacterium]|nr:heme exporter protein CcmD [Pseudomonadota bacterium]
MSEFLNMGGYAVYVWSSIGLFFMALIIDFISLSMKQKSVKRSILSYLRRKTNRQ